MAELDDLLLGAEAFEWDAGNAEKNWHRHDVSQLECEQVFFNQPLVLATAAQHPGGEQRLFALGQTDASRQLAVVFTLRRKLIRVISARPMSRSERRQYARAQAKEE